MISFGCYANSIKAICSFISFPYSKCPHAFEVFFCFRSNFCMKVSCNDLIFGVTISHCSLSIIIILCHFYSLCAISDRLVGLVVKASASRAEDLGFEFRLRQDFSRSSHASDFKIGPQWLPCQAPGDKGSALGLVGPVSVYCD